MKFIRLGVLIFILLCSTYIAWVAGGPTNRSEWHTPTTVYYGYPTGEYPNSSPAVVSRQPGMLEIIGLDTTNRSTTGSVIMYLKLPYSVNIAPVGSPLQGGTEPIAATSITPDRIDLYARGSGGYLYQTTYSGSIWLAYWAKPDGVNFAIMERTGPTAISPSSTTQDLFWISPDAHVRWMHWNGAYWEYDEEEPYYGTDLGSPAVGVSMANGNQLAAAAARGHPERIDIFVRGADNHLWQKTSNSGSWTGWTLVPGGSHLYGSPSAVSRYPGSIDVFYRVYCPYYGEDLGTVRSWTSTGGWSGEMIFSGSSGCPGGAGGSYRDNRAVSWSQYRIDLFGNIGQLLWYPDYRTPLPRIFNIAGTRGMPGSNTVTIGVNGTNFFPGDYPSVIHYKSSSHDLNLTTTFVNETWLQAILPATYGGQAATITVINPSDSVVSGYRTEPGGGTSNAVNYDVIHATPSITGTVPDHSVPGTAGFDLIVNGNNFYETASKVYINGVQRASCTWQAPTQFFVPLTTGELMNKGTIKIEVRTQETDGSFAYSNPYLYHVSSSTTKFGLFRPTASDNWIYSNDLSIVSARNHFGASGDVPLTADFNNDGTMDRALFRNGEWIVDHSMDGSVNSRTNFGMAGDKPLVGDFNNDGVIDRAVFRNGQWIVDYSIDGSVNSRTTFGMAWDKPLVGDLNNDGATDRAVFRSGQWIVDHSMDGTVNSRTTYGMVGDVPLFGDFNNDWVWDRAVFRSGEWIIDYNMDGSVNRRPHFGTTGDFPLVWKPA